MDRYRYRYINIPCGPKKPRQSKWFHHNFKSSSDNVKKLGGHFFKLALNFLWKFHVNRNWIPKLRTLTYVEVYRGLKTHVGDFRNYNHFIIFNFLLMSNISVTIEMYVESWVNVVKLDVQCDHRLLLPLFLIVSTIGRFNYWWNFFVRLSRAYEIAAERPSMSSYRFMVLYIIFFMMYQIA